MDPNLPKGDGRPSYNPGDDHARQLFDGKPSGDASSPATDGDDNSWGGSRGRGPDMRPAEEARQAENAPSSQWQDKVNRDNQSSLGSAKKPFSFKNINLKKLLKRGGPSMGVLGIIGAFFGVTAGVGSVAPLAFVEGLSDNLNDQLAALNIGQGNIFRNRNLTGAAKKKVLSGCTKLTVRCKFATISDTQVKRLKRVGIEVVPDIEKPFGRIVPKEYKFKGETYDPEAWKGEIKKSGPARNAQLRANNMKSRGFGDKTFVSRFLKRFGLSESPPGTKGSVKDRVNQLLTAAGTGTGDGVRFNQLTNDDGELIEKWELIDAEGNPVVDDNGKPKQYNKKQYTDAQKALDRAKTSKPPSKATKGMVGAASAFAYYDIACSVKNMIGAATIAAKVANQTELIKFSWNLVSTVHQIKAGDADAETYQAVGELLMSQDSRELISKVKDSNSVEKVKNPNYRKNAMDSPEVLAALHGGVPAKSEMSGVFTLGGDSSVLLGGVSNLADVLDTVLNLGDANACDFVQNPLVRAAGIGISIAVGIGSVGNSVIPQAIMAAAMISAMITIDYALNSALSGSVLDVLADGEEKVGIGTAGFAGFGAMQSVSAQSRGMKPASKSEIVEYLALRNETEQQYIAMERENINELDINSQHSALGSIARLAYTNTTGDSALGSLLSLSSSIPSLLTTKAMAANSKVDIRRFERCNDEDYEKLGIDADLQCNIRYIMSSSDLKMDPDDVAVYMENNFVDAETGLPEGYTPPDAAKDQNAIIQFVRGITIGDFFAERNTVNEYGAFLEYCAYRTVPYGETFEEAGLFGSPDKEWQTGAKCREQSPELSNFRMYTLYKSIQEAVDEDDQSTTAAAASSGGSGDSGGSTGGTGNDPTDGLPAPSGKMISPIPSNAPPPTVINAKYGPNGYGSGGEHWGIDISAFKGDGSYDFVSACDGVVSSVAIKGDSVKNRNTGTSGTTNYVWIKCDGGPYMGYAHFYADTLKSYIKSGYKISAGTPIAPVGCQGNSSGNTVGREGKPCGSHLHFQINPSNAGGYSASSTIDPAAYMRRFGVSLP